MRFVTCSSCLHACPTWQGPSSSRRVRHRCRRVRRLGRTYRSDSVSSFRVVASLPPSEGDHTSSSAWPVLPEWGPMNLMDRHVGRIGRDDKPIFRVRNQLGLLKSRTQPNSSTVVGEAPSSHLLWKADFLESAVFAPPRLFLTALIRTDDEEVSASM